MSFRPLGTIPLATLPVSGVSAAVTGTAVASITETDIVAGGKTIIVTLTGDTWVASGGTFDAIRQDIIDGLDAASSPANGWNNVVQALQGVSGVVRTSATVVTITLDAQGTYDIASTETITVTVPASAVVLGNAIVASPTFTVTAISASIFAPYFFRNVAGLGGMAGAS